MRTLAIVTFIALAAHAPRAMATSFSTNFSDIWSTPGESGWAVNITMQNGTLFASWFVYGVSATLEFIQLPAAGELVYPGDLYTTTGPWFGAPFDPNQVTLRKVGTASFSTHLVESAMLQYSVDGVNVVKQIARYSLRSNDLSGDYMGGTSN